jgi:hypothetical protein
MRWAFNIWVNSPQTVDPAAAGALTARGEPGGAPRAEAKKEPAAATV